VQEEIKRIYFGELLQIKLHPTSLDYEVQKCLEQFGLMNWIPNTFIPTGVSLSSGDESLFSPFHRFCIDILGTIMVVVRLILFMSLHISS